MSTTTINPDGTTTAGGTIGGGSGSEHAALSDSSDTTLVSWAAYESSKYTFSNPSIPGGAVIKGYSVVLRGKTNGAAHLSIIFDADGLVATGTSGPGRATQIINWTTLKQWQAMYVANDGYNANTITLELGIGADLAVTTVTKARIDVVYVNKPSTNVVYPTGTLTTDNRPTVWWVNTLDADGGGQFAWTAKIFDSATYSAGGFSPDTSTPVATSGGFTSQTTWRVPGGLADGNYRAYVAVSQLVNGAAHTSSWNYEAFTIDTPVPGEPTIDVDPQTNGRVTITLNPTTGETTTTGYRLERQVGDDEWIGVRTLVDADGTVDL